ncbi:MAG: 8-oxo-dGTP diphosphatase [Aerococcus sp.]|nr:8-oxo-dGTP diphosphatase [Aerococcus sp.]
MPLEQPAHLLTSLVYLFHEDDVLMMLRNKKKQDVNEGKWVGVGGKFENEETPLECACREVMEETGLVLTAPTYHGLVTFIYPDYPTTYMFLYSGQVEETTLLENDEGSMAWIDKSDIFALNLWEGDRFFLEGLLAGKQDIDMKLRYDQAGQLIEALDVATGRSLLP